MLAGAAEAARGDRHRSLLQLRSVTEAPEPEPEPDVLLVACAATLRDEVALWRDQGEQLLRRSHYPA